jgi:hypothetical protein
MPIPDEGSIDEPEAPDLATLVERAYLIAIGVASLAVTAIADAIVRSVDPRIPEENDRSLGLPVVARVALGAAAQAGALAVRTGLAAAGTTSGLTSVVVGSIVGGERIRRMQERLARMDERGQHERDEAELAANTFADALVPAIVDAVAVRLDLDRVVDLVNLQRAIDRISIDEIAAKLDLDAVAARLDIQAVVDRMNSDRFITLVMDRVLARAGGDGPPPGR